MLVAAIPNKEHRPRLGLAISRKVSPRAHVRNRLKRVIRDCFRHEQCQLGALDFVVVGRPGLPELSAEKLRASLVYHWKKLSQRLCEAS
jgi:ribonuclease P protein component